MEQSDRKRRKEIYNLLFARLKYELGNSVIVVDETERKNALKHPQIHEFKNFNNVKIFEFDD